MPVFKLKPACRETIWGGQRLREEYGMVSEGANIAEAWVLSCHPSAPSVITDGPFAGQTLAQYLAQAGPAALGSCGMLFEPFPLLIKLIDAEKPLSIQVHPSNVYAMQHERQYGKTEMWYILDAEPGAFLYYGFRQKLEEGELARRIRDNTLTEALNAVPVSKGDCFFIPAGTVHAIGAGILLAEVQQSSDVTYRVYDYGRRGADGRPRELQVEKAEAVADTCPPRTGYDFGGHLVRCEYFTVDVMPGDFAGVCDGDSFISLLVLEGGGSLTLGAQTVPLNKGVRLIMTAGSGEYRVTGGGQLLRTAIGTI